MDVYGEGGPATRAQTQCAEAVTDDALLPVRAPSGGFSEDPSKADISYTQSYSLVEFLIEQYGKDKILDFLRTLRDGATVDEALQQVYGFDIEGFEDAWRADIGAQPRSGSEAKPPTLVPRQPDFVPASISIAGPTPAPTRERPTPTPIVIAQASGDAAGPAAAASAPVAEATSTDNTLIILIGAVVVLVILFVAVVIVSRRRQRMNV
jgi:hypothetical protein